MRSSSSGSDCRSCLNSQHSTLNSVRDHVLDIKGDVGALKADVKQIDRRVCRIEQRQDRSPARWSDLIPLLWGAMAVGLAMAGKIPWSTVFESVRPG